MPPIFPICDCLVEVVDENRFFLLSFLVPLFSCCPLCCRLKVGITDGFVRVSCGVEDTEDLLAALKKGLDDL